MYAIGESTAKINGVTFPTFSREVATDEGALTIEAGSTGFKGGDRAAGGRGFVSINVTAGDLHFDLITNGDGVATGVEIAFCGDEELDAMIRALTFARKAITDPALEDMN